MRRTGTTGVQARRRGCGCASRRLTLYQLGTVRPMHQMVLERVLPCVVGADRRDGRLVDGGGVAALLLVGGFGHGVGRAVAYRKYRTRIDARKAATWAGRVRSLCSCSDEAAGSSLSAVNVQRYDEVRWVGAGGQEGGEAWAARGGRQEALLCIALSSAAGLCSMQPWPAGLFELLPLQLLCGVWMRASASPSCHASSQGTLHYISCCRATWESSPAPVVIVGGGSPGGPNGRTSNGELERGAEAPQVVTSHSGGLGRAGRRWRGSRRVAAAATRPPRPPSLPCLEHSTCHPVHGRMHAPPSAQANVPCKHLCRTDGQEPGTRWPRALCSVLRETQIVY